MTDDMRIIAEEQLPSSPAGQPITVQIVQPRKPWWKRLIRIAIWVLVIGLLIAMAGRGMEEEGPFRTEQIRSGQKDQIVAVYNLTDVVDGRMAGDFLDFVAMVEKDEAIKAVVLRVNSPGGAVAASERMHHLVKRLSEDRPVVVSMGTVAASGGYMLACGADTIIAENATVTGSIGVIAGWIVFEGTMEKIGAQPIVIKSTDADYWKDDISLWHEPDETQAADIRRMLDAMQARFNTIVAEGRPGLVERETIVEHTVGVGENARTVSRVETEPFNGKVYTAAEALELGMIDQIGFIEDAIDLAASQAGLDDPQVTRYFRRGASLMEALFIGTQSRLLPIEPETLDELRTPRFEAIYRMD